MTQGPTGPPLRSLPALLTFAQACRLCPWGRQVWALCKLLAPCSVVPSPVPRRCFREQSPPGPIILGTLCPGECEQVKPAGFGLADTWGMNQQSDQLLTFK